MKLSSLQFKVLLIVAGAMTVSLAVSVGALTTVYSSIKDLDRISREDFHSQQTILHSMEQFKEQVQEWKNVLLRGKEAGDLQKHWGAFEKIEKDTVDHLKEARSGTPHDKVRAKLEEAIAAHKAAGEVYRRGLEAFKAGDYAAGDRVARGVDRKVTDLMKEAEVAAEDMGMQATLAAVGSADRAYYAAIGAIAVTMVLALVFLYFFMRRAVLAPIGSAVGYAEQIAQGDLTADIQSKSQDETGQLLRSLSIMNVGLADVVSQVRNSAEAVVTAANQVAAGTTDLSQRTEEQASSLEETAASMEELASTVKQNADNAKEADDLARTASKRAEQGGAEVVRVVTTMTEISDSAKKISDIISVIDAIAFQTNILALNAAVEAARAGEQGRGFAVVASEVRSLAQRSAQAAKEIKDLIGASVSKVETGTQLVEQAGDTIQALVIDVKRVSTIMASIAEASTEQSRGVQQVNKTVTEMDKVVQQNASAVQQSAAAAEGMRRQAEALVQAVSTFRVRREGVAHQVLQGAAQPVAGKRSRDLRDARTEPLLARPASASTPSRVPATTGADDDWEQF
jgi:methyl-accepting chemotaxis protein